jgi:hypothetical protein
VTLSLPDGQALVAGANHEPQRNICSAGHRAMAESTLFYALAGRLALAGATPVSGPCSSAMTVFTMARCVTLA